MPRQPTLRERYGLPVPDDLVCELAATIETVDELEEQTHRVSRNLERLVRA